MPRVELFADDFDQHSFPPATIEIAIENLFPRAEVKLAFGDGDDDFTTQEALSKALAIDPVTLWRWEKGFSVPLK